MAGEQLDIVDAVRNAEREGLILLAARTCHQVNKAICEADGDHSQVDWDDAPEDIQQSAIKGVRFKLANPDAGPTAQHDAWMRSKIEDGWVYGPKKDAIKKEHPCIVPHYQLPPMQQLKDTAFQAVVKGVLGV